ncbi:pleckstrin homology domain-containing family F member 1 [Polymixia lowei]
MVEHLAQENLKRILAVESSFGSSGKPLAVPGRVLVGEGRLTKLSRRGPQPKVFFLFNDVLVYGSIILHGRWHKSQKIIPLEDIQLEDLEDSTRMKNQWLIRTPRKSFYVEAASLEEKQAWIEHIEDCRSTLLRDACCKPGSTFAIAWIPDRASAICMRCSEKFSRTHRRHHCRHCGFIVCRSCSKERAVIRHIHPTKPLRVCRLCHPSLLSNEVEVQETSRVRGDSTGKHGSDVDDMAVQDEICSDEEEREEQIEAHAPSRWLDSHNDAWSPYTYLKPENTTPN